MQPTPLSNGRKGSRQEKGYGECVYQSNLRNLLRSLQEWVRIVINVEYVSTRWHGLI